MRILPVIHHLDRRTSLEQADIAIDAGADGVFLISHHGDDDSLVGVATAVKARHPHSRVGLNFLSRGVLDAADAVAANELDMVWGDLCGVSSAGLTALGRTLATFAQAHKSIEVFASIAFKYQPIESDPIAAARAALAAGFVPTTSGSATGIAAPLDKIQSMSGAAGGSLAIASGMTVENVATFAPYLSHVLVSTGVSVDDYHFEFEMLSRFVSRARSSVGG